MAQIGMKLKIREFRKERGWTLEHLASVTGYSRAYMSQLENGRRAPSAEAMTIISQAFDKPLVSLLDLSDEGDSLPAIIQILSEMTRAERDAVLTLISARHRGST